ncbi:MAG: hypothetical protein D6755_05775 [Anaerolineae bacterium]|nr:MAG: hypothetical protein D6755_05775 [Anaerolineae bacterium]
MSRKSKSQNRRPKKTGKPLGLSQAYEFNPDYSYVVKDLRRIGALAGTFLVILVALSFFLG